MRTLFPLSLLLLLAGGAVAHGLDLHAEAGTAWTVVATYADGSAFSFESYEVFRPGDAVPFQVGRTDRRGRLAFLADAPGDWRVRLFSEDGHGGELHVDVDAASAPAAARAGRGRDLLTGGSVLFGLFGLLSLYLRRK